jgi:hypothetical protein
VARDETRRWQHLRTSPDEAAPVTTTLGDPTPRAQRAKVIVAKSPGTCRCGCGTLIYNGDRVLFLGQSKRYVIGHEPPPVVD